MLDIKALIKHLKVCNRTFFKKYTDDLLLLSDGCILVKLTQEQVNEVLSSLKIIPEQELNIERIIRGKHQKINAPVPDLAQYCKDYETNGDLTPFKDTGLESVNYIGKATTRYYDSDKEVLGIQPIFAKILGYPSVLWQRGKNSAAVSYDSDSFYGLAMPMRQVSGPIWDELLRLRSASVSKGM